MAVLGVVGLLRPWRADRASVWAAAGVAAILTTVALVVNGSVATLRLFRAPPSIRAMRLLVVETVTTPLILLPLVWPIVAGDSWPVAIVAVMGIGALTALRQRFGVAVWRAAGLVEPVPANLDLAPLAGERLGVVGAATANALAFPLSGDVLFTDALLRALTPAQLRAIHHHEAFHLVKDAGRMRMQIVGGAVFASAAAAVPRLWLSMVCAYSALPLAVVVQRRARRSETGADANAGRSADSADYAAALVAAHEQGLLPVDLKLGPHPPLTERLRALGVDPPFGPPARSTMVGMRRMLVVVVGTVAVVGALLGVMDTFS